jgi:hypothetical protein
MVIFRQDYEYPNFDLNKFRKENVNTNINKKIKEIICEIEYLENDYIFYGIIKYDEITLDQYNETLYDKYILLYKYETLSSS